MMWLLKWLQLTPEATVDKTTLELEFCIISGGTKGIPECCNNQGGSASREHGRHTDRRTCRSVGADERSERSGNACRWQCHSLNKTHSFHSFGCFDDEHKNQKICFAKEN